MTLAAALTNDLKTEADNTRKVLANVPEEKLGWRPHEKSMTLGELAGHLAENPSWVGSILESDLDFGAAASSYKPFVPSSRKELLAAFEKNVQVACDALASRDDALMNSTWTMRNGPTIVWQTPKHDAIRSTGIHHWIHHRGQLTVYLRLLGVPVPQTYGPTADAPSMG